MFGTDQRLDRFLSSAPDPTLIVDGSGVILFASDQIRPAFGYEPNELLGSRIELLMPERFRRGHASLFGAYLSNPTPRPMGAGLQLSAQNKDGTEFPVEISLSPVADGTATYVICAIRDVSERRRMEAELRATATRLDAAKTEAERANAVKSRFLAAASHDLRQPLQAATLYLSLLTRQVSAREQQETCAKMRQPLQTMGGILDALLDISMLDSGMVTPRRSNFALSTVLNRIADDLTPAAEQKQLKVQYPSTDVVVNSDPALLERILENLVSNAIRYTDRGQITITAERAGDMARVSVVDTGIGIPNAALDRIFDEYFQFDNPSRNVKKGLGLGLAIVKRLADLLEHRVTATSALGRGSTFVLELPSANVEVAAEVPAETVRQEKESGVAVLFVDDDMAIVDSLSMFFAMAHVEARSAENGNEALARLEEGFRPNVLISDYRLPNENGVMIVERVRGALGFEIPAIVMSGDTSLRHIEAQNISNLVVVQKPVDPDALIDLIYKRAKSATTEAT